MPTDLSTLLAKFLEDLYAGTVSVPGGSQFVSPSDGVLTLTNAAGTDFSRLQFGGVTASFPALKRSGADLQLRNGDDTLDGRLFVGDVATTAGRVFFDNVGTVMIQRGTGAPENVLTAGVGSLYLRADGGANTTLYIKQTGAGNTGWAAVTP